MGIKNLGETNWCGLRKYAQQFVGVTTEVKLVANYVSCNLHNISRMLSNYLEKCYQTYLITWCFVICLSMHLFYSNNVSLQCHLRFFLLTSIRDNVNNIRSNKGCEEIYRASTIKFLSEFKLTLIKLDLLLKFSFGFRFRIRPSSNKSLKEKLGLIKKK